MQREPTNSPNEKGYGMIFAHELDLMDKVLSPEEKAMVMYNFSNLIQREHGYKPPADAKLTDAGKAMYTMIAERFKKNIENASKRKPGGAPKGNKNAQKVDRTDKEDLVRKLSNEGMSQNKIATITGIPRTTVRRMIDGGGQTNIKELANKHNI